MDEKIICSYCNKKLIPFKKTNDWITRKYHKLCWQKKSEDFAHAEMMAQYLKQYPNPPHQ